MTAVVTICDMKPSIPAIVLVFAWFGCDMTGSGDFAFRTFWFCHNFEFSKGAWDKWPNDLKLSDRRGWRGPCAVGERRRQEAGAVTAAPVRCSAWLGDLVLDGIVIAK